jgi:hypothetical protein
VLADLGSGSAHAASSVRAGATDRSPKVPLEPRWWTAGPLKAMPNRDPTARVPQVKLYKKIRELTQGRCDMSYPELSKRVVRNTRQVLVRDE